MTKTILAVPRGKGAYAARTYRQAGPGEPWTHGCDGETVAAAAEKSALKRLKDDDPRPRCQGCAPPMVPPAPSSSPSPAPLAPARDAGPMVRHGPGRMHPDTERARAMCPACQQGDAQRKRDLEARLNGSMAGAAPPPSEAGQEPLAYVLENGVLYEGRFSLTPYSSPGGPLPLVSPGPPSVPPPPPVPAPAAAAPNGTGGLKAFRVAWRPMGKPWAYTTTVLARTEAMAEEAVRWAAHPGHLDVLEVTPSG